MTKTISTNLKAEMQGPLTKLATCMLITRTDGNAFGFTTHDRPLTIGGTIYEPAASFNPSDIKSQNDLQTDEVTVEGLLSSDTITEDELRAGYWDNAAFRIFQVNWDDLTQGQKRDRAGRLGEVTVHRQTFVAELLGLMDAYSTNFIEITTPGCRASLGDSRCGVVLTGSPSMYVTGTIGTSDSDFFTLHDSSRTEPDAYFDEGRITIDFPNGPRDYEVKAYVVGVWITKTPIAYDATGCTYTMYVGCDRTFATCCTRFNNAVNFRGEPHIRGNDKLVQVGRHS